MCLSASLCAPRVCVHERPASPLLTFALSPCCCAAVATNAGMVVVAIPDTRLDRSLYDAADIVIDRIAEFHFGMVRR